jgi:hypothetical protein
VETDPLFEDDAVPEEVDLGRNATLEALTRKGGQEAVQGLSQ